MDHARTAPHLRVPLSDHGGSVEEISLLVGHDDTDTTERVYRHQLRPITRSGAGTMGRIFHNVG